MKITKPPFFLLSILLFIACSSDDDVLSTANLNLNISGLENLGSNYQYEGWIIVNDAPVSTGTFTVNDEGVPSKTSFNLNTTQLATATKFVLSIEPVNDSDPTPSNTKILAGDFKDNTATVSSANIVGDFSKSSGKYILATPTDGMDNNESSGVWFLDDSSGTAVAGLNLPELTENSGWKYEGWVVIDGTPVSTGTFLSVSGADENATTSPYKGSESGPAFPGEDFIMNAPSGLTFPAELLGATIVISVEPNPDNSTAPFTLKPLAHQVPTDANTHTVIDMEKGSKVAISGTVTR